MTAFNVKTLGGILRLTATSFEIYTKELAMLFPVSKKNRTLRELTLKIEKHKFHEFFELS